MLDVTAYLLRITPLQFECNHTFLEVEGAHKKHCETYYPG